MTTALRVTAFAYHEVAAETSWTGLQRPSAARWALTPDAFASHLAAIARSGRRPGRVDAARANGEPCLALTFDDGGRSALAAADQLERHGWRGHFYVITGRLGARTFLAPADLRDLVRRGHLVGGHSHTHPEIFRDLPRARMLEEWRTSRAVLEDLLGAPCEDASVPGGDISRAVLETAAEAGIRRLFTSEPWRRARRVGECLVLGRHGIRAGTTAATVQALAEGRGWTRAWIARQAKEVVRRGLAPAYREIVRRRAAADPGGHLPADDPRQPPGAQP